MTKRQNESCQLAKAKIIWEGPLIIIFTHHGKLSWEVICIFFMLIITDQCNFMKINNLHAIGVNFKEILN